MREINQLNLKTLEELQKWFENQHFSSEVTTKYVIGQRVDTIGVCGIYKNEYNIFIVYKNMEDGNRKLYSEGYGEEYAVATFLKHLQDAIKTDEAKESVASKEKEIVLTTNPELVQKKPIIKNPELVQKKPIIKKPDLIQKKLIIKKPDLIQKKLTIQKSDLLQEENIVKILDLLQKKITVLKQKITKHRKEISKIMLVILACIVIYNVVNTLIFLVTNSDGVKELKQPNHFYEFNEKYYYYDEKKNWTCLNKENEWEPVKQIGLKMFFFNDLNIKLYTGSSNCYVVGDDYVYKCSEYKGEFYTYDFENKSWIETSLNKKTLDAFFWEDIYEIDESSYEYYQGNLFQIAEGDIIIYNDETKDFDKTEEVLDTPDFLKDMYENRIWINMGFYLYDNEIFRYFGCTNWEKNNNNDILGESDSVLVDKELIINSSQYYLFSDRVGYYKFGDTYCYISWWLEKWYAYENDDWKEITLDELKSLCVPRRNEKPDDTYKDREFYSKNYEIDYLGDYKEEWNIKEFNKENVK